MLLLNSVGLHWTREIIILERVLLFSISLVASALYPTIRINFSSLSINIGFDGIKIVIDSSNCEIAPSETKSLTQLGLSVKIWLKNPRISG